MKIISKDNIISVLLATACGIITADLFLRLYGIITASLPGISAIEWIKVIPKSFHSIAFWVHFFIVEIIVLGIIIIIMGCIIGAFLKINKIIASIIAFLCFELSKIFIYYRITDEFLFINLPIIYFLLISAIAFCLFWFSFYLGGIVRKKIR
jgi:hypothetical protein